MSLHVDLDRRRVEASVRGLLEQNATRLRGRGEFAGLRAALGAQIHRQFQARMHATTRGFESEVDVELVAEVDGFEVSLRGRVDALWPREHKLRIEEVKSVQASGSALAAMAAGDVTDAGNQARLYGLCLLERTRAQDLEVAVRLVSIVDESERVIEVPFDVASARALLEAYVRQAIAEAQRWRLRCLAMKAAAPSLRLPFEQPRPHQEGLIDAIDEALAAGQVALVSAPTGVGKTVSALLPALRRMMTTGARLFFATSKTSQQALVIEAYQRIIERAGLGDDAPRATTLRARSRMCPPGDLRCHPKLCPYLVDFDAREAADGVIQTLLRAGPVVDPDAVYAAGEQHRLCPYELGMEVAAAADVLVGDYNYVFDPGAALQPFVEPTSRRFVVVVDEAHNLPDRARGYASMTIAQSAVDHASAHVARRVRSLDALIASELDAWLGGVTAWIGERLSSAVEQELTGVDDCTPMPISDADWPNLGHDARLLLLRYGLHRFRNQQAGPGDPILDLLRRAIGVDEQHKLDHPGVLEYVAGPNAEGGCGSGVVCVDPSTVLEPTYDRLAGAVLMSATLAPMADTATSLGLGSQRVAMIEVPSPFPPENRLICIDTSLRTVLAEREAAAPAVADRIRRVMAAKEGRYAAFFPSFAYLGRVQRELGLPRDQTVVQLPGMSLNQRRRTLDDFSRGPIPRLLLGVTSGSFAEGIDLPADALLGAVIVGPALPGMGFERELMRQYFDDAALPGFARAYVSPGMRGVVQAAGRVIRTMSDRGVIVLLGERFVDPEYACYLPPDWIANDVSSLVVPDLDDALASFWAARGSNPDAELR